MHSQGTNMMNGGETLNTHESGKGKQEESKNNPHEEETEKSKKGTNKKVKEVEISSEIDMGN